MKIYRSKYFNPGSYPFNPFIGDDIPISYIEVHIDDLGHCWRTVWFGLDAIRGNPAPNDAKAVTICNPNEIDEVGWNKSIGGTVFGTGKSFEEIEEILLNKLRIGVGEWEILDE